MRINHNNTQPNFKSLSAISAPLSLFYNPNSTIPTALIETGVTSGRTFEAFKRGGKIEGTERLIEQGVSAVVWLWGVQTLKKCGDFIGKNIFHLNLNFDIGKDILRDPVKNNAIKKSAVGYKAVNMIASTILSTLFIGFLLPKITRYLTGLINKDEIKQKNKKPSLIKTPSLEEYKNSNKKKDIHFTSLVDNVAKLAYVLENNAPARLVATDGGVISGRCINAKNKYKKLECLFRDTASIYFYLLFMPHLVKMFNKLSKNTDINPDALIPSVEMLKSKIGENALSADEFSKLALSNTNDTQISALKNLFKDKEVIDVNEFIKVFPSHKDKALQMAQLQPIFKGEGVLTYKEAQDVLNDAFISDPKFLKKMFNKATKGLSDDKMRFVSKKKLEKIRTVLDDFLNKMIESAKKNNQKIDKNFVEKYANKTMGKNLAFYGIGVVASGFILGILIPKVQYLITKKLTKKNEFPGMDEYK